ncbi:hypothetical protein LJC74_08125 [Eubacteriales bacterium OttesenSCG-928-A19]|nr:hypothetical protein [Eubacteriales bacterium OttesenSCG-928-A19]
MEALLIGDGGGATSFLFRKKEKKQKKNLLGASVMISRRSGKVCPTFQKLAAGGRSSRAASHRCSPASDAAPRGRALAMFA